MYFTKMQNLNVIILCECSLERKHIAGADLMIPRRFFYMCATTGWPAYVQPFFFYVQRPARLARQVVYKMVSNRLYTTQGTQCI